MKLCSILLILCTINVAIAWWEVGHMTVSQIAYNYLKIIGKND